MDKKPRVPWTQDKGPGIPAGAGVTPPAEAPGGTVSQSGGFRARLLSGQRSGLAWRLGTTYLLVTLFILVGLGLAIYLVTAFYIDEQLDAELTAQADFYAAYVAHLAPDKDALVALAPTIVGLFSSQSDLTVRVFSARYGMLLAATQDIGPQPSQAALATLKYRSPNVFTQASRDLDLRRYAARPVLVGGETVGVRGEIAGVVEVSRSTLVGERFLTSLRYILLATLLVASAISLGVSVFLARRMSRPIRDVEQATHRIAAGDLNVRLGAYPLDEIGQLAQSVNRLAERLQHLEDARSRFISEISHDLRTPLTALKGLLVNLIDDSESNRRPSLEIAERETDRLIRLVNQLLDFSRWQSGHLKLNREIVDVGEVARDAVALVDERVRHRRLSVSENIPPDLPTVLADRDRLERVILNLVDNAIKYTPAGGRVTLVVTRREDEIEFSIRDTGRGMTVEEQEKAFQPYHRGEGGGAGLGLSIARAIVEMHGGRMGIDSRPDRGSRVWFTLPM